MGCNEPQAVTWFVTGLNSIMGDLERAMMDFMGVVTNLMRIVRLFQWVVEDLMWYVAYLIGMWST